jgi:hypothetical protein
VPGESPERSYGFIVTPGASRGALVRLCLPVLDLLWSFVLSAATRRPCTFPLKSLLSCECIRCSTPTPQKAPKIGFFISCSNPFARPTPQSGVMAETVLDPALTMVPIGLLSPPTPQVPRKFVFPGCFS